LAKQKTTFICQHCGTESAKWQGKCPSCHSWNTFVEEIIHRDTKKESWTDDQGSLKNGKSKRLEEISDIETNRLITLDKELNRVLGGGIVEGSVILVAGIGMMGFGRGNQTIFLIGILLFSISTIFSLVTLPVEYDASNRALAWLESTNVTNVAEHDKAKDALKWAARTYVVAAISSVATLLYYIMIFMNRSRD
jgi:hypothetical protein